MRIVTCHVNVRLKVIYNGRDDLPKMNFVLEFIKTEKLVTCFDG
jgi:hypothetical protein